VTPGTRDRVLPALAGGLLAASFPPLGPPPLVFIALVPLLVHIERCPDGPAGRWRATVGGLIAGAACFGLQLYWLLVALMRFSALAIPAYLGAVLVLAALVGVFAWATHLTRDRLGLPLAVRTLVLWTALEWARGNLGDLAFPWLGLGAALSPWPVMAGAADLVGGRGLTAWIGAVNGLLATATLRYGTPRRAVDSLALALVVLAAPVVYGVARASTLPLRPAARVALVQPNIPEEVKLDRDLALDSSLTALGALTRELAGRSVDLVVWPEVALPADLEASAELRQRVRRLTLAVGAPILVGAYGVDGADSERRAFNSAFLVGEDGGRAGAGATAWAGPRYDKRRLVPFVERIPFGGDRFLPGRGGGWLGDLSPGRGAPLFDVDADEGRTARFGILICFESIFPELSREYRRAGADFIVNITNDAWFGGEAAGQRTAALWQHPAHLVLRAIETRTGIARAANTGVSMIIDPIGRVRARTPLFEPAVRIETVQTASVSTLFSRWGDWVGTLCAVVGVLFVVGAWASLGGRGGGSWRERDTG
jgi:apolipoprotein N-acyltransferase